MSMFRSITAAAAAALALSGAALLAAQPAEAQSRGRIVHAHGPHGGGYVANRHVSRQPGATHVSRGVRTHGGYGVRQTRDTHWGNGTIRNDVNRTYANGRSVSRSGTVTRHPDGSVSSSRQRTGAAGNRQSGWSTIYRTDDGYTRTRGGSTSSGRGYNATRNVSVGPDSVTVNRNASTSGGRSVSSSRTYPRR